jgi:toxin YoeB
MIKAWSDEAWEDYTYWFDQNDRRVIKQINKLIKDIDRTPYEDLGKPEPLKYDLSGKWSRRITQEHRLIYKIRDGVILIYSCRDYY